MLRQDFSLERMGRTLADLYFLSALRWAAYTPGRDLAEELEKNLRLLLEGMLVREAPRPEGFEGGLPLVPGQGHLAPLQGGLVPLAGEQDRVPGAGLEDGLEDGLLPVGDELVDPALGPGRLGHGLQDGEEVLAPVVLLGEEGLVREAGRHPADVHAPLGVPLPGRPHHQRSLPGVVGRRVFRAASRLFPVWAKSMTTRKGALRTTSIRPGTPGKVARPSSTGPRPTPRARAAALAARAFSRL